LSCTLHIWHVEMGKDIKKLLEALVAMATANIAADPKNAQYWADMRDKGKTYEPPQKSGK